MLRSLRASARCRYRLWQMNHLLPSRPCLVDLTEGIVYEIGAGLFINWQENLFNLLCLFSNPLFSHSLSNYLLLDHFSQKSLQTVSGLFSSANSLLLANFIKHCMFAEWIFQLPSGSDELTQNIRISVLSMYHLQLANISLPDCHNDFMFFSCKCTILIALSEFPQVTLVAMPLTLGLSINYRF